MSVMRANWKKFAWSEPYRLCRNIGACDFTQIDRGTAYAKYSREQPVRGKP